MSGYSTFSSRSAGGLPAVVGSFLVVCFVAAAAGQTDPVITSWMINTTAHGQTSTTCAECGTCTNPGGDDGLCSKCNQIQGCVGQYEADVQAVLYDPPWSVSADQAKVYIQASGVPSYPVGPFCDTNPQSPSDRHWTVEFLRDPPYPPTGPGTDATPLARIGMWVNGVSVYNPNDGNSYLGLDKWHNNAVVVEAHGFDAALGHSSAVMPPQQCDPACAPAADGTPCPVKGAYHHHQRSPSLAAALGDTGACHSPIMGYAFDGYPIYGPYGYKEPFDPTSGVVRMRSGYRLRSITQRHVLPGATTELPEAEWGPDVCTDAICATEPSTLCDAGKRCLGYFMEDYEYNPDLTAVPAELDEHNGRECVTPEYPSGIYAYFATIDENGNNAFPYTVGLTYRGVPDTNNYDTPGAIVKIPAEVLHYAPAACGSNYWVRVQKITDLHVSQAGAEFGRGMSIVGDLLAVGAPYYDDLFSATGEGFTFRHRGGSLPWQFEQNLTRPDDPGTDIHMGRTVAADPNAIITGDEFYDAGGAVSLFRDVAGVWSLVSPDVSPGGSPGEDFGHSVAVEGDIAAVGAPIGNSVFGVDSGAVAVLRGPLWHRETTLYGDAQGNFGTSVAVDDDRIVVGDDFRHLAFLYERPGVFGWIRTTTFAPSCEGDSEFGASVDICGDRIVVGSPRVDGCCGRVYVYGRSGSNWVLEQRLVGTRPAFGESVSISDDIIVVGAPAHVDAPEEAGAAVVFERCGGRWTERQTLQVAGGELDDGFGQNVDVSGEWIAVSAHLDDEAGLDAGAVYLYHRARLPGNLAALNGFGELPTRVWDLFEPFGSGGDRAILAAGSARRGGLDVPVLWREVSSGNWSVIDLSEGQPRSGSANRFGGAGGSLLVAGAMRGPDGREHATVWQQSGAGWPATTLPEPEGADAGEALSVLRLEDGAIAAVGQVTAAQGVSRPAMWMGTSGAVLPGLAATGEGRASDVAQVIGGDLLIIGWAVNAQGAHRAVYWRQAGGQFEAVELPGLADGGRGQANDLSQWPDGRLTAAGEADTADGQTRPVLWTWNGGAWTVRDLGLPAGASAGRLNRCLVDADANMVGAVGRAFDSLAGMDLAQLVLSGCENVFEGLDGPNGPLAPWLLHEATALTFSRRIAVLAVQRVSSGGPLQAMVLSPTLQPQIPPGAAQWTCGNGQWSTTSCWSGLLAGDVYPDLGDIPYAVTLPAGNYGVAVNPAGDNAVLVNSLNMPGRDTKLVVSAGRSFSVLDSLVTRGSLIAEGGTISVGATASADVNETNLTANVSAGVPGVIRLPISSFADVPGLEARQINVSGAGSRIELPNLAATLGNVGMVAGSGGFLDLPSLAACETTRFTAQGAGSLMNLPALSALPPGSAMWVVDGGRINAGPLTRLDKVDLRINGPTSFLDVSRIDSVDNSIISIENGAVAAFPLVTHFVGSNNAGFVSSDAGSVLDLGSLVSMESTNLGVGLSANNGGKLIASNFSTFVGGDFLNLQAWGSRAGVGAELHVQSLVDPPPYCGILIGEGAKIFGPPFTDLSVTTLRIDGPNVSSTADYNSFLDTRSVTQLDNANVQVSNGAKIAFPGVTRYQHSLGIGGHRLSASGSSNRSSLLSFPALTELRALTGGGPIELVVVNGGARVSAPALSIMSGQITIRADQPGSEVELGLVRMDTMGIFDISNSGEVRVHGDVDYAMTDPTRFRWVSGATLTLLGGSAGNCTRLEVAGKDLGNVVAGFSSNFQLQRLVIGPGARVRLADDVNNGNRAGGAPESLYVETLEFADADGRIQLGSLHLYYHTLIGKPTQVVPLPCVVPESADLDGDGDVDGDDVSRFQACATGPSVPLPAGCSDADLDGDGDGDHSDFGIIQRCYGGANKPTDSDCAK